MAVTTLKQSSQLLPATEFGVPTRQVAVTIKRQTQQLSNYWIISVFGLLLCTFLFYFHSVIVEYQANKKQIDIIKIKEENDMLQAKLSELKTLPAVEARANKMGMQPVDQFHYISVDSQVYDRGQSANAIEISAPKYPMQPPIGY